MECLPVWNRCNNKCLMCSNPVNYARIGRYALSNLKARIRRFDRKETDIYLTGGEPSLYPELFELLAYIRSRLPKARILMDTNGRMFSYRAFAAKCAAAGNIEFQVSLCGHNAAAHDAVTLTPGSFSQTVAGIRNLLLLKRAGAETEVRFVLSGLSIGNLSRVYAFAEKNLKSIKALVFIFMEMEGHAAANQKMAGLTYRQALAPVKKLFSGKRLRAPFEIKLYHFPLCTLPQRLWKYAWRTLPEKEITFPPGCAACKVRQYCLGVHKDYLRHFGAAEFRPVRVKPAITASSNFCHPILAVKAVIGGRYPVTQ
ncbi:MAG TPA: hypothetical protein DER10_02335 [Elusimicrobia bacterium]|nr:hypothetical protein [Elusimicrobiota bacterium]HCE97317.1 hypothetical protein [Elusimicrobiota bacterium]